MLSILLLEESGLLNPKNFNWPPLILKFDTNLYPGLMGRSLVPVAFAKRHERTNKINTLFIAMVFAFVYWSGVLLCNVIARKGEMKKSFGFGGSL